MLSYEDIIFEEPASGIKFNMYKSEIDYFNKTNLGGLITIGLEFSDMAYLEIVYNPSITSSVNEKALRIRDNCWEIKMGVNINKTKTK